MAEADVQHDVDDTSSADGTPMRATAGDRGARRLSVNDRSRSVALASAAVPSRHG
jgi:hypothetical protein